MFDLEKLKEVLSKTLSKVSANSLDIKDSRFLISETSNVIMYCPKSSSSRSIDMWTEKSGVNIDENPSS